MSDRQRFFAAVLLAMLLGAPAARADGAAAIPTTLHLADAVRIASSATPTVEIAALRKSEADAKWGQARSVLLPSLSGTASDANRTFSLAATGISFPSIPGGPVFPDLIGPVETFDARVRVSQPVLDLAGIARIHAADHGTRQAIADQGSTAEASAQNAALVYLRVARAKAALAARETDIAIAQDLLGLAEAQQAAGTAPIIDAIRARAQLATSRSQRLIAQNAVQSGLMDLARALGQDPGTVLEVADTLGGEIARSDAPEVESTAIGVANTRRTELTSEREKGAKARLEGSALSRERIPRVDVAADWGLSGAYAENAATTRQYGIAASVPLFDGLRRESKIDEQKALQRESEVRVRDLGDQVSAEVRQALLDLSSGRELEVIAADRVTLAEQELAQARERFVNGVAGNIEIIDAQSTLVRARDTEIEARFVIASARVALARATGVARTLR